MKYRLLNVIHHDKCMYDPEFFKKGHAILLVDHVASDDNTNLQKRLIVIKDPTIKFHVTKNGHTLKNPKINLKKEFTEECEVPYSQLFEYIAKITGQEEYLKSCKGKPQATRRKKVMHLHRDLHSSDQNLADNYIKRYLEKFNDNLIDDGIKFHKVYADIEVDIINYNKFPDERVAPRPISLISLFDGNSKILTQFILPEHSLHNKSCPSMINALSNINELKWIMMGEINRFHLENSNLIEKNLPSKEITNLLINKIGWEKSRCNDINLIYCDDEKDLILKFIYYINEVLKPDFVLWWNMRFDIQTIINRLIQLNVNPEQAFTCEAFKEYPMASFYRDENSISARTKKDEFTVASPALWMDSQIMYAKIRIGESEKISYKLNAILEEELGEQKLDYAGNISDLLYRDYSIFLAYGAIDVTSLYALEEKLMDVESIYSDAILTRTRIQKATMKTIVLTNFLRYYCEQNGQILSNNRNVYAVKTDKLPGAFVLNPALTGKYGISFGGSQCSAKIYDNVADIDAEALYPSTITTYNIDPASHIGLIYPCSKDGVRLRINGIEQSGSNFIHHIMSKNMVELGVTFMEAPDISELLGVILN